MRFDACYPRPLSPFELLTGERFRDHLSRVDMELDRLLQVEANAGRKRSFGERQEVREWVIEAYDEGLDTLEIARAYGLSEPTVRNWLQATGRAHAPWQRVWCLAGAHWWACDPRMVESKLPWTCDKHAIAATQSDEKRRRQQARSRSA